jgi:hypothetical protein
MKLNQTPMENTKMETKKSTQNLINTIFIAVALAMGVAVVVLNLLKVMPADSQTLLLGFGLALLAVASLSQQ